MSSSWFLFLISTLIAIAIQGLLVLFEMACISFNRVRLQYYVSQGKKRALWLHHLLQRPSRLFGTTLIGINAALQIGSECSRRFYESVHLNPDWAPLTQIVLVVIFAELAPLFAARRHPEQAAMTLIPVMAILARLLFPLIWAFDAVSHGIHHLMGTPKETPLFLSREEVKMAFEEKEDGANEFNQLASQIFRLKNKAVGELIIRLSRVQMISSLATLSEVRHNLSIHYAPIIPIYHRTFRNIVAIAQLRDLLRLNDSQRIAEHARSPWFVPQGTSVLDVLDQFRRNNQSVAVILDASGQACGILTLDDIVAQIFGVTESKEQGLESHLLHIERTLPGDMEVALFNKEFQANLPHHPEDTLSDLILHSLGHLPAKDEAVKIGSYLFTVVDPSMRGVKTVSVKTVPVKPKK